MCTISTTVTVRSKQLTYHTHVGVRMYKCTVYTGEDKKERKETTRRRMLSFVAASTLKKLFAKRFEECVREETAHLATLKSKSIQVDNLLNLLRDCRD